MSQASDGTVVGALQIWYGWNIAVLLDRTFIIPKVRMRAHV